jgi:hypothetical protein
MSDQLDQPKPIWLRLTSSEKEEIEAIAKRDDRSTAYMLARIVRDWLEEQRKTSAEKVVKNG